MGDFMIELRVRMPCEPGHQQAQAQGQRCSYKRKKTKQGYEQEDYFMERSRLVACCRIRDGVLHRILDCYFAKVRRFGALE